MDDLKKRVLEALEQAVFNETDTDAAMIRGAAACVVGGDLELTKIRDAEWVQSILDANPEVSAAAAKIEREIAQRVEKERPYWDGMPAETVGEQFPSDNLVQELLEVRANIKLEGYGRHRGAFADGLLAGRLDATEDALRLALKHLDVSPRKRYIVEHVLGQKGQTWIIDPNFKV